MSRDEELLFPATVVLALEVTPVVQPLIEIQLLDLDQIGHAAARHSTYPHGDLPRSLTRRALENKRQHELTRFT